MSADEPQDHGEDVWHPALVFYQLSDGPLLVFVGEGAFLKVFDATTSRFLGQAKVFTSQIIHGIFVGANVDADDGLKVAFWGGRSFILLRESDVRKVLSWKDLKVPGSESLALDWILDGAISPSQKSSSCLFVTAHSTLVMTRPLDSCGRSLLKALPSKSQSILYSAHVLWISAGSAMVAGGTVFGEIEVTVWDHVDDDSTLCCRQVFCFTGHDGSIFGVRISPEIVLEDGNVTRQLASCSDDRTIRVWDVSLPEGEGSSEAEDRNSRLSARETGFGENELLSSKEESAKRCVAVVMAHASRIWRVEFLDRKTNIPEHSRNMQLLSFGEDATCYHWSLDMELNNTRHGNFQAGGKSSRGSPPNNYSATLNRINAFSYHSGKHIWSASIFDTGENIKTLVTGGADGKVAIYDINLEFQEDNRLSEGKFLEPEISRAQKATAPSSFVGSWHVEEILPKSTAVVTKHEELTDQGEIKMVEVQSANGPGTSNSAETKKRKPLKILKDAPNRYAFVGQNKFLVTTSFGRVCLGSLENPPQWANLELSPGIGEDLKSYSVALGIPSFGIAIITGASGTIYVFHENYGINELSRVNGKVVALIHVSSPDKSCLRILATTLGHEMASLFSIDVPSLKVSDLKGIQAVILPTNFVLTSAGNINDLLIIGARNGTLAIYDLFSPTESLEIVPAQEAKSDDAVTSIVAVPSQIGAESTDHFLMTSRNGSYTIFLVTKETDSEKHLTVTPVHKSFPPLGPMVEAAWFSNSDLFLYGFRSKNFIVWNETKQVEIASIECGGSHRSYAYLPGLDSRGAGSFIYTKASKLYLHSQSQPSHRMLKLGGHGREIKASASHAEFVATGAEDTTIRIWRRRKDEENNVQETSDFPLTCCAVIEKHTAGIQALKWCCSSDDYHSLYSAGGNEEFHIWAISTIPGFGIGVICEATLTDLSEDRDLRIMGFDVELMPENGRKKTKSGSFRISNKAQITLVYSDSTIKEFFYSRRIGFRKVGQGRYTSACLTQILSHDIRPRNQFFTAATDGHLCRWEVPVRWPQNVQNQFTSFDPDAETFPAPEINLLSRQKLHQSSISAIALNHLTLITARNCLLIATGGDDNALTITLFQDLNPLSRLVIPAAHAAAITGLEFKSDMTGGPGEETWVQLISVGGDQRVKRWTIELYHDSDNPVPSPENVPKMRLWSMDDRDDVWTSVADASGLVSWRGGWLHTCVMVVGNGMEVFRVRDGFPNGDGWL